MIDYKFPDGRNGAIQHGYTRIEIINGIGKVDENNTEQVNLALHYGGVPQAAKKPVSRKRGGGK